MESINEVIKGLRNHYVKSVKNLLDPGYIILTLKTNPLSKQEQQFKEIYANTISLHSFNILLTIPTSVYYYHYFMAHRKQPIDEKRLAWARRRITVFMPLCLATMVTAYAYEKANDFTNRLKQIEQFYLDHKDEDINQISFTYKVIQAQ